LQACSKTVTLQTCLTGANVYQAHIAGIVCRVDIGGGPDWRTQMVIDRDGLRDDIWARSHGKTLRVAHIFH
jgi:hypothetical protein